MRCSRAIVHEIYEIKSLAYREYSHAVMCVTWNRYMRMSPRLIVSWGFLFMGNAFLYIVWATGDAIAYPYKMEAG